LDALDPNKFTVIAWDPPGYGFSRAQERLYVKTVYQTDAELAAAMMQASDILLEPTLFCLL
jgi:valacyclovir hydrolase